jgi:hypothetical protein
MNDPAAQESFWTRIKPRVRATLLGPTYAAILYISAFALLVVAVADIFGRTLGIEVPRGFAAPSVLFCAVLFATRILAGQQQISREVVPSDKLEKVAIKSYPIWEQFYGTYYAVNAPWELEMSRFRGDAEERRRFKEYLATHVRRYCGVPNVNVPTVATARYIYTSGSLKRHCRQLDNFAQFMSALRAHAGQAKWRTIASRVNVVEIESPFVSTVFSGHRVDETGQRVAQSIIYIDAPGCSHPDGVPRTVLMTHNETIFDGIESWYEDNKAARVGRSLEEWLEARSKRADVEPPIPYRAPSVFLSYARADQQFFDLVHRFLEQSGLNPWFDQDVDTGDDWKEHIETRLQEVDCGVLLHSKASAQSAWVGREREILADARKLIVIRLDETPLPATIDRFQHNISFRDWKGDPSAQCARKLLEQVERFVYPPVSIAREI